MEDLPALHGVYTQLCSEGGALESGLFDQAGGATIPPLAPSLISPQCTCAAVTCPPGSVEGGEEG